jgi:hypothetical protein
MKKKFWVRSPIQSYDRELQHHRCKKFTAQLTAWLDFRYTFHPDIKSCLEFKDCNTLDETSCLNCVTGEKLCKIPTCNQNNCCEGTSMGNPTVQSSAGEMSLEADEVLTHPENRFVSQDNVLFL